MSRSPTSNRSTSRSNDTITETDVAVEAEPIDVMMAVIGPDINENFDTGQQGRSPTPHNLMLNCAVTGRRL